MSYKNTKKILYCAAVQLFLTEYNSKTPKHGRPGVYDFLRHALRNCLNLFVAGFEKDCHLDF